MDFRKMEFITRWKTISI